MAELSPAAQAVVDSMYRSYDHEPTRCLVAAAVLRTVADQVVPQALEEEFFDRNHALTLRKMVEIRQKLLAIAIELENHSSTENHA